MRPSYEELLTECEAFKKKYFSLHMRVEMLKTLTTHNHETKEQLIERVRSILYGRYPNGK